MKTLSFALAGVTVLATTVSAAEFHVSLTGSDQQSGAPNAPLRTIQRAADLAQPGDVITVHAGTYRERITPPRGGISNARRIVYQAAAGETVAIKGSEVVTNWVRVSGAVWKTTLPNSFFGAFNPYLDLIRGDWFTPKGREHHTGAVYLNGDWLIEAAKLQEVLNATTNPPVGLAPGEQSYLLNVAWIRPGDSPGEAERVTAARFAAQQGIQTAACSEGGECIGWIEAGDWVRYERVDFGERTDQLEIRAASATEGGNIELRLDKPDGELLGTCLVTNTGDWQAWSSFNTQIKPVAGIKNLCLVFKARKSAPLNAPLWFSQVDPTNTTIWAQFRDLNPNEQLVEINVRQTVFYPAQPGVNFLTVRGFALRHAATPWAPPTAEQIGLIGTHWSKGWIIESNTVSHSICSGIALGKYGDAWDNTSADTAEGYVLTIHRALTNGWNQATIGHHVVRHNAISHCEQAGIVGSLGAAFSAVSGNDIHDIHVRRLFSGAEMAGIKFHAAIDTVIGGNHIHRTCRGLWLDWMAQGTRVSGNLFHENASEDLFVEVDHGPFVVDNNLFLSATSLLDMSEGGAYAHNLFAGRIVSRPEPNRATPFHPAHTTALAGLAKIKGGDDRFYNNLFVGPGGDATNQTPRAAGFGLWVYDERELPLQTGGNVYFRGARPYAKETNLVAQAAVDTRIELAQAGETVTLQLNLGGAAPATNTALVTTERLGKALIPGLGYENSDGSPLRIDTDYFGQPRDPLSPTAGPFERPGVGLLALEVWPMDWKRVRVAR